LPIYRYNYRLPIATPASPRRHCSKFLLSFGIAVSCDLLHVDIFACTCACSYLTVETVSCWFRLNLSVFFLFQIAVLRLSVWPCLHSDPGSESVWIREYLSVGVDELVTLLIAADFVKTR